MKNTWLQFGLRVLAVGLLAGALLRLNAGDADFVMKKYSLSGEQVCKVFFVDIGWCGHTPEFQWDWYNNYGASSRPFRNTLGHAHQGPANDDYQDLASFGWDREDL